MRVWADADSLPRAVRELLARRVALELGRRPGLALSLVFVANRQAEPRRGRGLSWSIVPTIYGAADQRIFSGADGRDLVVTRDIALAERLLAEAGRPRPGAPSVINDRGDVFAPDSVAERRSLSQASRLLCEQGLYQRPGHSYGPAETKAFAQAFDREFSRLLAEASEGVEDA